MSDQLQSELVKAASATFERLGFVLPDMELQEWQASAPLTHSARVRFTGPVHGALHLCMSDDVAAEMTANMLGMFDEADRQVIRDALGEIANVICGNLVPTLGRPEDVFDLSAPEWSGDGELDDMPSVPAVARLEVGIEEGRAVLSLFIDSPEEGVKHA